MLGQGPEVISLSPFYLLFHPIGELFHHLLIGYRFLSLVLLSISACFLSYTGWLYIKDETHNSTSSFLAFTALTFVSSSMFFLLKPTLSYNTLGVISSFLWVSSILLYLRNVEKSQSFFWAIVLTSFSVFLAFASRPTYGFVLFLGTLLFLFVYKRYNHGSARKEMGYFLAGSFLFIGCFVLINSSIFSYFPDFFSAARASTHTGLISKYKNAFIFQYKKFYYFPIFWILFVILLKKRRFLKTAVFLFTLLVITKYVSYLFPYNHTHFRSFTVHLFGFVSLCYLSFLTIEKNKNRDGVFHKKFLEKRWLIFILPLFAAFFSSFGTNNDMFVMTGYCSGLIALPFIFLLYDVSDGFRKNNIYPLVFGIIFGSLYLFSILQTQHFSYYRNGPSSSQIYLSKKSTYLKHIKIEKDLGESIDKLIESLHRKNFNFKKDRIFAYPDLPGFLGASGVKSFGSAWNVTKYRNIDNQNCAFLNLEPVIGVVERIYLLKGRELSKGLEDCLFKKIVAAKNLETVFIGRGYHYRNREEYNLLLEGPYFLR